MKINEKGLVIRGVSVFEFGFFESLDWDEQTMRWAIRGSKFYW
jgi:hypothetical protein